MLTITQKHNLYPNQLNRLHSAPKQLYVESSNWESLLQQPILAVVGTRRPSSYAATVCAQFVREIASKGVCIVSGLALGIDSIAHQAAIEVGGSTIAVLPAGLSTVYPASHRNLAKEIVKRNGALVSEYPSHISTAFKPHFIERNRIIAGLSSAVFIPEAAAKSGSLHTAQFAIDSGIDVCALPGSVTNPLSEGCHRLIQSGAALIATSDDITNVLGIAGNPHNVRTKIAANSEEASLIDLIESGIHDADELLQASHLAITVFNQTLTMLEITGKIRSGGGNSWYLT
jgi:DNA processing protein